MAFSSLLQAVLLSASQFSNSNKIPHQGNARYRDINSMFSFIKDSRYSPATTTYYSVHFATPNVLRKSSSNDFKKLEAGNSGVLLDYYANAVNLPSKQLMTGQITTIGTPFKYGTGQAFSQINITFMIPRNQVTRSIFERWMTAISSDSDQYADYYDDYCCDTLRIFKMEKGGGKSAGGDKRFDEVTALYEMRNVFPTNIGAVQLNNMEPRLMTLTVGFSYERYRFYSKDDDNFNYKVDNNPPRFGGFGIKKEDQYQNYNG